MKKELLVKIGAGTMALVVVISFFLLFLGRIRAIHFWFIIILAAIVAYVLLPWLKKN